MQGAAPLSEANVEISRQTERDKFQGYVPLWLTSLVHLYFQNPFGIRKRLSQTSKVVVNSSDIVNCSCHSARPNPRLQPIRNGMEVQTLGAQVLILGIALFDCLQLIEQRFVTDLEDSRRLATIPPRLGQHPFNGFLLGRHGRAPANLQQ